MIVLHYRDISNPEFQTALQKLMNFPVDGHLAYLLNKIEKGIHDAQEKIRAEYKSDILALFAKKNEDGTYDENTADIDDAKIPEWKKAYEEFSNRTVTIDRDPIPLRLLREHKFTGKESAVLEAIVNFEDAGKPPMPMMPQNIRSV